MDKKFSLAQVLEVKAECLDVIHDAAIAFIEAGKHTERRHVSAVMVLGILQEDSQPLREGQETTDLKTVVLSKGLPDDFGLMFDQMFELYPQLFAMVQQAVVNHVSKHYNPEETKNLLKKS